jgi:hypothetical protein
VLETCKSKAKERQKLSKGRGEKGVEILPDLNRSRDEVGELFGVSGRYVDDAVAAKELKQEGKTQAKIGGLLGVSRSTVANWFQKRNGHNVQSDNMSIDCKVKIPPKAKPIILARVDGGETPEEVAAERRAGELLRVMDGKGDHGGNRKSSRIVKLEDLGITRSQSSRWQKIAAIPQLQTFRGQSTKNGLRGSAVRRCEGVRRPKARPKPVGVIRRVVCEVRGNLSAIADDAPNGATCFESFLKKG